MKIELINDHYKKIPESFKKKEIKKLIDEVLKKIGLEELENGQINITPHVNPFPARFFHPKVNVDVEMRF